MNISTIAHRINKMAFSEGYRFKLLQQYRKQKTGKRNFSKKPFSASSIKGSYAFHTGGRQEMQFNIGYDWINNKKYFRFGLAFSLEKGRSLINPLEVFKPKIKRFNSFFEGNRKYFQGLEMDFENMIGNVKIIDLNDVKVNSFIFIGQYIPIKKKIKINKVLELFDKLMSLYLYVEDINPKLPLNDKIARICWNRYRWIEPSGTEGKSRIGFESKYGYGHEEWLFETDKIIDGYSYAFLQPINHFYETYIGETFNLYLYTIDNNSKTKYWIGKLNNVEVINRQQAREIFNIYKKNGWIKKRKEQLKNAGINTNKIDKFWDDPIAHFNIRYNPEQVKNNIFPDPQEFSDNKKIIKTNRYTLLNAKNNPLLSIDDNINEFDINSGNDGKRKQKGKTKRKYKSFDKELELKHNQLSDSFLRYLRHTFKNDKVKRECKASVGCRVDIVRETKKGNIFYELKTYNHLITCFRYAIGQLLEYVYYPNVKNAGQLVVVSDLPANRVDKGYLKHLRKVLGINLRYIQYDLVKEEIVEEI